MATIDLIVRTYTDLDHRRVVEVVFASADHAAAQAQLKQLKQEAPAKVHLLLYTVPLDTDLTQLASYPVIEGSLDRLG
ncbi:phosphoribosylaminoimidazole carboxylase [Lacticaseibacillus absianus]|uniref:phosphoribosylaminoimidazole carboxylase n=1 Tax=Lacticaseibacillus absianus TaxID=2729623 RepID=UPI0015C74F1B|nr:phosphoribosylaminoimidazole carboxylase [Lacticaseibacillus absianus]